MPLPSTYQTRTAATFATNGSLLTKNTSGIGYRDLAVTSPNIKDLNINTRNNRMDARKRGYTAKYRYVAPATISSSFEMVDVTISVNATLGATVSQANISAMLVELVDFLVAQNSVLGVE